MKFLGRKGQEKSWLSELILIILAGIIIIAVTVAVLAFTSASVQGMACGVNVMIRGIVFTHEMVPLFMCKQYEKVIDINPNNYEECSGLNLTICSAEGYKKYARLATEANVDNRRWTEKDVQRRCQEACARTRLDQLANDCWNMGGKGYYALFRAGPAPILKCFRVRITLGKGADGGDFTFSDNSGGIGGDGSYNKLGPYALSSSTVNTEAWSYFLDYSYDKPHKICYISFIQYIQTPANQYKSYPIRSCSSWDGGVPNKLGLPTGLYRLLN